MAGDRTIGVLALQGAVREHLEMIEACGARGVGIKRPSGLNDVDGLVIPGGESTTIGKLIREYGFEEPLKELGRSGVPVFGTCAGLIVMAREIAGKHGPVLGLIDVSVERNAFGRQVDSFEREIEIRGIAGREDPFRAVFIRAPLIEKVGDGVEQMARLEEGTVMARQRQYLVAAFHPELTRDKRVHEYFKGMIEEHADGG